MGTLISEMVDVNLAASSAPTLTKNLLNWLDIDYYRQKVDSLPYLLFGSSAW